MIPPALNCSVNQNQENQEIFTNTKCFTYTDTNIWVILVPIHGYLYILLPILKFHINTDTKRYQYRYKNDLTEVWQSAISKRLLFTFFSLNFVFQKRLSSIKSRLPSKVIFCFVASNVLYNVHECSHTAYYSPNLSIS